MRRKFHESFSPLSTFPCNDCLAPFNNLHRYFRTILIPFVSEDNEKEKTETIEKHKIHTWRFRMLRFTNDVGKACKHYRILLDVTILCAYLKHFVIKRKSRKLSHVVRVCKLASLRQSGNKRATLSSSGYIIRQCACELASVWCVPSAWYEYRKHAYCYRTRFV